MGQVHISNLRFRAALRQSLSEFNEGGGSGGGGTVTDALFFRSLVLFSSETLAITGSNKSADVINVQQTDLDIVQGIYLARSGGIWSWGDYAIPGSFLGPVSANVWYTVDLALRIVGGDLTSEIKINGVDSGSGQYTLISGWTQDFSYATVGARAPTTVEDQSYYFDDVKLGTSGFGSSGVLSANFESAIVPPFDDVFPSPQSDPGVSRVANPNGSGMVMKSRITGASTAFAYRAI